MNSEAVTTGLAPRPNEYLVLAKRSWSTLLVMGFIGFSGGVALAFNTPKLYESSSTVLFASDSGGINFAGLSLPGLGGGGGNDKGSSIASLGIGPARTPTADLAENVLNSGGATESVFDELHLDQKMKLPKSRDLALNAVKKSFLKIVKRKSLLTISCRANSPELARDMVQAYFKYYKAYSNKAVLTNSKRQRIFVEKQLEERVQLRVAAEKRLVDFERSAGMKLVEATPEVKGKMLGEVLKNVGDLEVRARAARAKLGSIREATATSVELSKNNLFFPEPDDKVLMDLQGQLAAAKIDLVRLSADKTDYHPEVLAAKKRIQTLEYEVEGRLSASREVRAEGLTKDQVQATAEFESSEAAYEAVIEQERVFRKKLESSPEGLLKQRRYVVDLALQQELEKLLQLELARAKIKESSDSTDLEILDPPGVPLRHVSPSKLKYGLAGGVLAFVIAAVFVLFKHFRSKYAVES